MKQNIKKAKIEIISSIFLLLVGLVLTILLDSTSISYMMSHKKVSAKATYVDHYTIKSDVKNKHYRYRVEWSCEFEGDVYTFTTIEDHIPHDIEQKTVKGYIDNSGNLVVASRDGILGLIETIFAGPIILLGGIVGLIAGILAYKRDKKSLDDRNALIEDRIASQEEYEAYIASLGKYNPETGQYEGAKNNIE